jgi:hypothetical protein
MELVHGRPTGTLGFDDRTDGRARATLGGTVNAASSILPTVADALGSMPVVGMSRFPF